VAALAQVAQAQVIVVAFNWFYKAAHSGPFKVFWIRCRKRRWPANRAAADTGGSPHHMLVSGLRVAVMLQSLSARHILPVCMRPMCKFKGEDKDHSVELTSPVRLTRRSATCWTEGLRSPTAARFEPVI
jgi:hypothetical protein